METIFVVNVTQTAFFRYSRSDGGYNKLLLELLTPQPSDENSDEETCLSHWSRKDKIVIAPKHMHDYIERTYNELYL
jgi:hypothetical protein